MICKVIIMIHLLINDDDKNDCRDDYDESYDGNNYR